MRKAVQRRTFSTEDEIEIRMLAASRKAAYRLVQRAKGMVARLDDPQLQAGQLAGFSGRQSGVDGVKRFNHGHF